VDENKNRPLVGHLADKGTVLLIGHIRVDPLRGFGGIVSDRHRDIEGVS